MRLITLPEIGIMKEGIKDAKKTWELRKQDPTLWYFLLNTTILCKFFRGIIKRENIIVSKEVLDKGVDIGPFHFKNTRETGGLFNIREDILKPLRRRFKK